MIDIYFIILKVKRERNFFASALSLPVVGLEGCDGVCADRVARLQCHSHVSPLIYSPNSILPATPVPAWPGTGLCWEIVPIICY